MEFLPSHISNEGTNGSLVLQILLEKFFKNYYSLPENVYRKTNYDGPTFEALKILVRTYLSQLQIWQLNMKQQKCKSNDIDTKQYEVKNYLSVLTADPVGDASKTESEEILDKSIESDAENCDNLINSTTVDGPNEDYLFSKIRWPYLDMMPPFYEDEVAKITQQEIGVKNNGETDLVLKKLQVNTSFKSLI